MANKERGQRNSGSGLNAEVTGRRHSKHILNTKLNMKSIIHPPNLESPVNRRIASFGQWEETGVAEETHTGPGGGCKLSRDTLL